MKGDQEIQQAEKRISDSGYYPYRTAEMELEELRADNAKLMGLFSRLMFERLEKWVQTAEERFAGTNTICYVCPGNDDVFAVDPVIDRSRRLVRTEGRIVRLDEKIEMISTGFSNISPWKCPRDIPDEELGQKIEIMANRVVDMENCVFNLHSPPYDTILDKAPLLDQTQKIVVGVDGRPQMASVGSQEVRKSIERYQPLLALHGHIHESRGVARLGRTTCVNPGSEYQEGILRGAIVKLNTDAKKVRSCQLVSG